MTSTQHSPRPKRPGGSQRGQNPQRARGPSLGASLHTRVRAWLRALCQGVSISGLAAFSAGCGVKAPPTPLLEGAAPRYQGEVNARAGVSPASTPVATPTPVAPQETSSP